MPKGVYKREENRQILRRYDRQTKKAKIRRYNGFLAQIAVRFGKDEYKKILAYSKSNNLSLSNAVRTLAMKSAELEVNPWPT
jgi:hypothetical protein